MIALKTKGASLDWCGSVGWAPTPRTSPTKWKVAVGFWVRIQGWVGARPHLPRWGCERSNRLMFFWHIDVALPLSPSLPRSLKIKSLKK